jgi:hypothetical protein
MIRWTISTAVAVVGLTLALVGTAQASTIHAPPPGASVQQNQSLLFDWAWTGNEYWTANIVFTQVADGADPIWLGGDQPGKVRVGGQYGYGDSHATITFSAQNFAPGQWYWRLCNNTTTGEDDKCYYDGSAPIPLTISAAPVVVPPPAPVEPDHCFDNIDNDADGKVDLDDMDNSSASNDYYWCDHAKPAPPKPETTPRLTVSWAKHWAKTALKRKFGNAYRYGSGKRLSGTTRLSRTKVRFSNVFWFAGDMYWQGRLTIWHTGVGDSTMWNYAYTIKRTNDYCKSVLHHNNCTKTFRVR